MPIMVNNSLVPIMGVFCGHKILFEPGKRVVLKSVKTRNGEILFPEDMAKKFMRNHKLKGLQLIDDEQLARGEVDWEKASAEGLEMFIKWLKTQIRTFNVLNQKQAAEGLATLIPPDDVKEARFLLHKLTGRAEGFISEKQLASVARKGGAKAVAILERVKTALESEDIETALQYIKQIGTAQEEEVTEEAQVEATPDVVSSIEDLDRSEEDGDVPIFDQIPETEIITPPPASRGKAAGRPSFRGRKAR